MQKRRAQSVMSTLSAPEDFVDARSRTPTPDRSAVKEADGVNVNDADFWDDWMDQYVCGAAEDVKEKLKYYYYRTGRCSFHC